MNNYHVIYLLHFLGNLEALSIWGYNACNSPWKVKMCHLRTRVGWLPEQLSKIQTTTFMIVIIVRLAGNNRFR